MKTANQKMVNQVLKLIIISANSALTGIGMIAFMVILGYNVLLAIYSGLIISSLTAIVLYEYYMLLEQKRCNYDKKGKI